MPDPDAVPLETVIAVPPDVTMPVHSQTPQLFATALDWRRVQVMPPPVAVGVAIVTLPPSSDSALTTMMSLVDGVKDEVVSVVFVEPVTRNVLVGVRDTDPLTVRR
jgi:hypothetical protein